jgi:hypothetical protein
MVAPLQLLIKGVRNKSKIDFTYPKSTQVHGIQLPHLETLVMFHIFKLIYLIGFYN